MCIRDRGNKGRIITKKEYKILRHMFVSYVKDESGTVSHQEFLRAFEDEGPTGPGTVIWNSSVASVFRQMDTNSDGTVTFRELLLARYPQCSPGDVDKYMAKYDSQTAEDQTAKAQESKVLTLEQEEELEGVMKMFDLDGDGLVDKKEMALYCTNLGIDEDAIEEWFSEFDLDKSGTLDMREFKEFFRAEWGNSSPCLP
eukprot:TRINITY_DN2162_c0_g4_i1.p1 TRINITY_DN2162_c0_g4~~TRINITY_DN2162_c0_g4_i1.p1  ORF type:complete len:199 (+),score=55.80 TRINITY_DN2162_c0_g4_i1:77-673(+)